jgi:hypothetical protein
MAKEKQAPADGEYVLDGNHYIARKGEPMPEGAEFIAVAAPDANADEPATEARANPAAPDNRALKAAPENRAK